MTDVSTVALVAIKPSSADDSGFRNGFGAESLLPLAQCDSALSQDIARLD